MWVSGAVFYSSEEYAAVAGTTIFVAAALTDWLDGYLARKMGVISEFGAFLDPVADKLMVAAALVLLCTRPLAMPWARLHPWILPLPAIAIIGREVPLLENPQVCRKQIWMNFVNLITVAPITELYRNQSSHHSSATMPV
jgi:hypothetical protein